MEVLQTTIPEVMVIKPKVFGDERGYFFESFSQKEFAEMGLTLNFVQDNQSLSKKGVLRGIHYQIEQSQGKLVRVTAGSVLDVAVDLRRQSSTFGQWVSQELSAENFLQLWIPPGFGHAFLVLSDSAVFQYKTTDFYAPQHERTILWNDEDLGIDWPLLNVEYQLSGKDQQGTPFLQAEVYEGNKYL